MERNHSNQVANLREYRRFKAWELYQKGWKQKDIAVALGVTKGSVSQWVKRANAAGVESLRHRKTAGARPHLTPDQKAQLPGLLPQAAAARIHLEQLPAYAPELNPDEGIWNYLKRLELKNLSCHNLPHLRRELRHAKEQLRHKTHIVQACFKQTGLV